MPNCIFFLHPQQKSRYLISFNHLKVTGQSLSIYLRPGKLDT